MVSFVPDVSAVRGMRFSNAPAVVMHRSATSDLGGIQQESDYPHIGISSI